MPERRFYTPSAFSKGEFIYLEDQEMHHMIHVMRIEKGEIVELVNGLGELAEAYVEEIDKKKAKLSIRSLTKSSKTNHQLILAQGLPRMARLEYIVEKATELAVTEIRLFIGDRSESRQLLSRQTERLQSILISSMKQCNRLFLPTLSIAPAIPLWERPSGICFFGDTTPHAPSIFNHLSSAERPQSLLWLVGPEGGLSEKEEELLRGPLGFQGVSINKNTLRTDTAAIAGLAVLSSISL